MDTHQKIRKLREANNWSQEEMAGKLNLSRNNYANIENGQTKLFSEKLLEIADIFGVELHDLLNPDMCSVTILVNENHAPNYITSQYQGNRYDMGNAEAEIEKLNMTVAHQSEMLKQKDAELTALRDVLALLKQKLE